MLHSIMEYHQRTSYTRRRISGGYLDWSNQPSVYKTYIGGDQIPLPRDLELPEATFYQLLKGPGASLQEEIKDLKDLARLLVLACAITARAKYTGGEFHYRSVPSAGALYPCEIYVACENVQGLSAGLYHYSLQNHSLVRLRPIKSGSASPDLCVFITSVFFRSSWKYGERSYRYMLLDAGHLLENLLLALRAFGVNYAVHWEFPDREVNEFLGLDPRKEACLVVVRVGKDAPEREVFSLCQAEGTGLPPSQPIAPREHVSALIEEVHAITCIHSVGTVKREEVSSNLGLKRKAIIEMAKAPFWTGGMRYTEALWSRRSRRSFSTKPISCESFGALMGALRLAPESFGKWEMKDVVACGVLVGKVHGIEPGFYLYEPYHMELGLIREGDFIKDMARAALDQGWMTQASLHLLALTDLDTLQRTIGPRAYRYAMLVAGMMGQRAYLASTALGLGACGVGAFYDDEVARLLGLSETSRPLYIVAVGAAGR